MSAQGQVAEEKATQTGKGVECPYKQDWTPTKAELEKILADRLKRVKIPVQLYKNFPPLNLCNANLRGSALHDANSTLDQDSVNLSFMILTGANLYKAELNEVNLWAAKLNEAHLTLAKLNKAYLPLADLTGAYLSSAKLNEAHLTLAKLNRAVLVKAQLNEANLVGADLTGAQLDSAELTGANLSGAKLGETTLKDADLSGVTFEPAVLPSADLIADARNLFEMRYEYSPHALVSLRKAFKDAGFRRQEREITYAIKMSEMQQVGKIERAFNFVLFELTTEWGMRPGRPLWILGALILLFTGPYIVALRMESTDGIWRVWADTRIRTDLGGKEPEKIETGGWNALGIGLYFSVLSTFHIGWRDLNVGSWIARIQRREYALSATGWARVVSGLQSLISVYLLAMWAITYFGRPFE